MAIIVGMMEIVVSLQRRVSRYCRNGSSVTNIECIDVYVKGSARIKTAVCEIQKKKIRFSIQNNEETKKIVKIKNSHKQIIAFL